MTKEELYNIYKHDEIENMVHKNEIIELKAKRPVLIGNKCLLKVNTNIGVSDKSSYQSELNKLCEIVNLVNRPDSIMDHSIVELEKPLWKSMIDCFDGAVGTLPHYLPFNADFGLNINDFFDNLTDMANGGVSFVTLHPTADINLYFQARATKRYNPTTSRGGYVLLKDQRINNRRENIVAANFEKILKILREHNMMLSVGSVFRPSSIHEAMDDIHIEETKRQKYFIDLAKKHGVKVQMEGIGHISLDRMKAYAELIKSYGAPLMPLGPMPSDEIIGFDHISNAIGATAMALTGVVGMINSVTREEHTGKVPSTESIIEGIQTAITVAHCYNISRFPQYMKETETVSLMRSQYATCVMRGGIFSYETDKKEMKSCSRCKRECPLQPIV